MLDLEVITRTVQLKQVFPVFLVWLLIALAQFSLKSQASEHHGKVPLSNIHAICSFRKVSLCSKWSSCFYPPLSAHLFLFAVRENSILLLLLQFTFSFPRTADLCQPWNVLCRIVWEIHCKSTTFAILPLEFFFHRNDQLVWCFSATKNKATARKETAFCQDILFRKEIVPAWKVLGHACFGLFCPSLEDTNLGRY